MKRLLAATLVLGLTSLTGGCARNREIVQGRPYPQQVTRAQTLDIQVIRRSTRIELTNTTGRNFGPSIMWLNGRFSKNVEPLPIGKTLTLRLSEFEDEYGESFRGGGFFATEKPELLSLAELQPEGTTEMLPLVVVRGEE